MSLSNKQRGIALVMVMLIVAMATTLATFMAQQQSFWQRGMENGRDRAQARRIAEAGVDWARAVLADDSAASQYDHAKEMWAMQLPAIPVENGEVRGVIHDRQGVFNLNNLVRNGVASSIDVARYQRLLSALDLPQGLAATLTDWMDANDEPSPSGAEDGYYLSLERPYRCANQPLSELGELMAVRGYDAAVIKRLEPYISVLPESGTMVNVNFAPAEVLMAMLPGLGLQDARQLALTARTTSFKTLADFYAQLPAQVPHGDNMNLDVRSNYFLVSGHATQGAGVATVHALLYRSDNWPKQRRKNLQ